MGGAGEELPASRNYEEKKKKNHPRQSSELTPLSDLKLTSAASSPRACRAAGLPWCAAGARGKPQA